MAKASIDKSTSTFEITDLKFLERFVMCGSSTSTVSVSDTLRPTNSLINLMKKDGIGTANYLINVLKERRAAKNDFALFALALCLITGNTETKRIIYSALPSVCVIPTDLFMFVSFYKDLNKQVHNTSGWGNGAKKAIARWYNDKSISDLVFAVTKFKQRHGWSHKDLLRMAHPKPPTKDHDVLYRFITSGKLEITEDQIDDVRSFTRLQSTDQIHRTLDVEEVVQKIKNERLSWEHVPTEFLKNHLVWKALLPHMKPKALIRNLGRMTAIGVFETPSSLEHVKNVLTNPEYINSVKLHPLVALQAYKQYVEGKGDKGKLLWHPVKEIAQSLEKTVDLCFKNIQKTNSSIMIGLDISSSMKSIAYGNITARSIADVITLACAKAGKETHLYAFTKDLTKVPLSQEETISSLAKKINSLSFGATDCSMPIKHALKEKIKVDAFIILTDNENNPGSGNPSELLEKYRKIYGNDVKLVCVSICQTNRSILNPDDLNSLEISGFDASIPQLISDFIFKDNVTHKTTRESTVSVDEENLSLLTEEVDEHVVMYAPA
jgi:60 kDa SS-A/Ro ribonucleoprotein